MNRFAFDSALVWIPVLPLLAAIIVGLAGSKAEKGLATSIAVGSVALSFVLSCLCAIRVWGVGPDEPTTISNTVYTWFSLQGEGGRALPIDVRFAMDGLSALMAVMVTGVGLLIHVYSASYMHDDDGYTRFFAYLNLFTGSMLVLVLATGLPVLFVGWEGVGICSYLLIGFWFKTPEYAAAGKKAFIVNRIGDVGVLLGMLLLAYEAGSVEMSAINSAAAGILAPLSSVIDLPIITVAALLLFLGCAGKSAQLPLYVWLPDAMAGPTPVSALIHAATMVTAGVYLCCRMSPVFLASPTAMAVIAVVGASTALFAATIAVVQNDLKKILAYSTVSQLGFMFGAVGAGAFSAGIFHVFTHAFFKACLFLGAGSVMHAVGAHGDVDITKLGGLRGKLKVTSATFIIATLAIAGFPLLSGFFSKDAILAGSLAAAMHPALDASRFVRASAWFSLAALVVAAVLTAFYMTRAAALTFTGKYKGAAAGLAQEPHESPRGMTVPLIVLATGAVVGGLIGVGGSHSGLSLALGSSVMDVAVSEQVLEATHKIAMGLGTAAALIGLGLGWLLFVNKDEDAVSTSLRPGLRSFLMDSWHVERLYDRTVLALVRGASEFVAAVDRTFLELGVITAPTFATKLAATGLVRTQNGYVQTYGLAMAVGLIGALAWLQWPKVAMTVDTRFNGATFHIAGGLGQRVDADFDSDGELDVVDSTETEFDVTYRVTDLRGVAILATLPPNDIETVIPLTRDGEFVGDADLGMLWRSDRSVSRPLFIRAEGKRVFIRRNGQPLMMSGRGEVTDDEAELGPGDNFQIGRVRARIIGITRAVITTRSAFGETRTVRRDIVLRDSHGPRPRAAQPPAEGAAVPPSPTGAEAHP